MFRSTIGRYNKERTFQWSTSTRSPVRRPYCGCHALNIVLDSQGKNFTSDWSRPSSDSYLLYFSIIKGSTVQLEYYRSHRPPISAPRYGFCLANINLTTNTRGPQPGKKKDSSSSTCLFKSYWTLKALHCYHCPHHEKVHAIFFYLPSILYFYKLFKQMNYSYFWNILQSFIFTLFLTTSQTGRDSSTLAISVGEIWCQ